MITRAQPHIISSRIQALIRDEICKGCIPDLSPFPVRLEPDFYPVHDLFRQAGRLPDPHVAESKFDWPCWTRLRVWLSPNQPFDWNRSELFLKQLAAVSNRVGFEVAGNEARIDLTILVHRDDRPIVATAFDGAFDRCKLMPASDPVIDRLDSPRWQDAQFEDYHPPPPYFRLLSSFEEFKTSPFEWLLCALHQIKPPSFGLYQCLFQPVRHNWHANVELLQDLEYGVKLQSGFGSRFGQQLPSGDLHRKADDLEQKAHNDKPFFAAAVRIGVAGGGCDADEWLPALTTCMNLFQHGGRPLCHLGRAEYRKEPSFFADAMHKGKTYRPGFLVNSRELAGLVHVFSAGILEHRQLELKTLETLPVRNPKLNDGTNIGLSHYGEKTEPVCIPYDLRSCATHILANPGAGKSTLMINMILQDIQEGKGAAFVDAHGDAVKSLLKLIPKDHIDRCIYFDPGDPNWIPSWNPLHIPPGSDVYRMTTDFLSALERISKDWGDRLACVLRNGLVGLSYIREPTLNDLLNLVRQKSPQSEALRRQIIALATDENVRHFWEWDFLKDYRPADLASPRHKLSPLISGSETVRLMVSQPRSAIQLGQIMEQGHILLVDLSGVGSDTKEVLGALILSLFLMATIRRSKVEPGQRRPFAIYTDEAHLFVSTDAIENMIAEGRKFNVSPCIAHQYRTQFKSEQVDALSIVGSAIFGRLDKRDSQYFSKDLQNLVDPDELIRLKPYEMIARIGTDIVRVYTQKCEASPSEDVRSRILERTHREYCLPADEVRRLIASRSEGLKESFGPLHSDACQFSPEDLAYDEF